MFPKSQLWLLAVLVLAGVVSAFSGRMDSYVLDVAMGVGINIVLAVSLNLINGFTGQFSLGHAGFMAVGAYTSAMLTTTLGAKLGWSPALLQWVLFPASLILGGLLAALAGLAVGAPSLRLKGDYLAIVTLGFGEIIKVIFQNVDAVGGARGLIGVPAYANLFWTFGVAAVTVYVVWGLLNSTYGRGFLAVADDEVAAEAMGLNTTRYKITAFVVGSFFAGVAGGLYAHLKGYLNPGGFDFNKSIEIVVMVILGGMGRHVGVIIAAILLGVLTETLRSFGDYRMIIYSLLLIVLMLTRPQGLFVLPRVPDRSRAVQWANRSALGCLLSAFLGSVLGRALAGGKFQSADFALFAIRALAPAALGWISVWIWVRFFGKGRKEHGTTV